MNSHLSEEEELSSWFIDGSAGYTSTIQNWRATEFQPHLGQP